MDVAVKTAAKRLARALAIVAVAPALASFAIRSVILGRDRALMGSSQALALIPGVLGQYLRTAFLRFSIARCHPSAVVEFGTILSSASLELGENVYVGPMCHIGWALVGRDVLVGSAVHIPSGPDTHGIADPARPIREQPGTPRPVSVGAGCWIGSAAIVMHDIGEGTVVAAGAVVTRPLPAGVIAGGIPAKILRSRIQARP